MVVLHRQRAVPPCDLKPMIAELLRNAMARLIQITGPQKRVTFQQLGLSSGNAHATSLK